MKKIRLNVNGQLKTMVVDPEASLASVLREQLLMTGTKVGCGQGQCGCCNVILDGRLVRSCVTKMSKVADGASVLTIEGVGRDDNLHPLQLAWMIHGGAQCGFCTPGFIVSAKALLDEKTLPHPGRHTRLVPGPPQRLPLHRLQATGRLGHGRGRGSARRKDQRRPDVQAARGRPRLGRVHAPALGHGQGHRDVRLRGRRGLEDAGRNPAPGPGPGRGLPRQTSCPSTLRKRKRCPASTAS